MERAAEPAIELARLAEDGQQSVEPGAFYMAALAQVREQ
jgi:hypothetical protein